MVAKNFDAHLFLVMWYSLNEDAFENLCNFLDEAQ